MSDGNISETESVIIGGDQDGNETPPPGGQSSRFYSVWNANGDDTMTHPSTPKRRTGNSADGDTGAQGAKDARYATEKDEEAKSRLDLDLFLNEYAHYLHYVPYNNEDQQKAQYYSLLKLAPTNIVQKELLLKMHQVEEKVGVALPPGCEFLVYSGNGGASATTTHSSPGNAQGHATGTQKAQDTILECEESATDYMNERGNRYHDDENNQDMTSFFNP